jgi:hypothetical protein
LSAEPVRDDAALLEALKYARNHPDNWDQRSFRKDTQCGTTYCIAGFKTFAIDGLPPVKHSEIDDYLSDFPGVIPDVARTPVGEIVSVPEYARAAFGLNEQETYNLFYAADSRAGVEDTVKRIMNDEFR